MHYYRVALPKRNHFNDEFDNWIEVAYSRGTLNTEYEDDDIYGIVGQNVDDIPISIIGETEDENSFDNEMIHDNLHTTMQ